MSEGDIPVMEMRQHYRVSEVTSEERTWAALAHASMLVTLALSIPTLGVGGLLTVWLPLAIYAVYKDKSDFVAFHAMQAFLLQLISSIGFLIFIIVGSVALIFAWVLSAVLVVILIGLLLLILCAVLTGLFSVAVVIYPFVVGIFSMVATIQAAGGADYSYPYVGRWAERMMENQAPPAPLD